MPRSNASRVSPPPELTARFRDDLAAVHGGGGRLGLAVSGGPDSLALLLLAHAALPGEIAAATVDHGLRPGSAAEAAMVAQLCGKLGVPHATLPVEPGRGNLQDRARAARYIALAHWGAEHGIAAVLTAHHADDQAETLLMRLNRGSGLSGLAGVRPVAQLTLPDGAALTLCRPLLHWRKAELEAVVAAAGLAAVRDPSNAQERFDRVRIRRALADADWLDPLAMAHSARHLAEAEAYLRDRLEDAWRARVAQGAAGYSYRPVGSRYEDIEIAQRILHEFGATVARGQVAQLVDRLAARQSASLGGVLARPKSAVAEDASSAESWHFASEPPRRA